MDSENPGELSQLDPRLEFSLRVNGPIEWTYRARKAVLHYESDRRLRSVRFLCLKELDVFSCAGRLLCAEHFLSFSAGHASERFVNVRASDFVQAAIGATSFIQIPPFWIRIANST